ncbi:MAG: NfeD family protein, partial [Lentisphaeria bacterium]
DHTEEIIAHIQQLDDIPVYVFVNQDAISAGAMISIACDQIYMSPRGRIGAAAPIWMGQGGVAEMPPDVREKMLSIIRALMRGLANENGYNEDVAMAMVDDQVEVKIGDEVICDVGELLMMTAEEAVRIYPPMTDPILATGIVDDIDGLLAVLDMPNAEIINIEPAGSEQLAKIITALAPLLMFVGMMGIYMELKTPGFGVPGIVGTVCISIYFFGHYVAGLAGVEDMALVIIGIALIALEIFIIPGFGISGILGIFCLFGGLFMAMIPNLPDVTKMPDFMPEISLWPYIEQALMNTSIAVLLIAVGGYCLGRYLPNLPFFDRLILRSATRASDGYVAPNVEENSKLIGEMGMTLTPLRPSGIAIINNRRVDVVSNGDFIDQDERIMVKRVQGARVVVIPVAANSEPAESA